MRKISTNEYMDMYRIVGTLTIMYVSNEQRRIYYYHIKNI